MTQSAAPDSELPNLGLLIKLLKMTTSNTDAEALAAMRKANEQLSKFGGDWEALLRGKVTVIGIDPFASMPAPPKREATPTPRTPVRPAPRRPVPPSRPQAGAPTFGTAASAAQAAAQARQQGAATQATFQARQAARPWKPGPSGGKLRSNLYAGPCVKCGNQVPVDDGFSFKDSSWNTSSRWQIACHPCFYKGAPAGYTAPKPTVTNIDLDSLA